MRTNKLPRAVLTIYNGRLWINIVERKGPLRGCFASKEAAIAIGRAHALDAGTTHIIQNEAGEIVETASYERLPELSRG